MYCENCGEKLPENAKFCQNCGTQVQNSKINNEKSSSTDANEIIDNSLGFIKSGVGDFKSEWSTWSTKKKFISIIACCCIGWILISNITGVLTPDKNSELFDQTNEGKNISLIKESTSGYAFYSSNKTVYNYDLNGVLKNIPMDSQGFTVHGTFYDENGKVIKETNKDLDDFTYSTEKSSPTTIVGIQTYEFVNVSKIKVTIMNPSGDIVFDESYDFNMDKFDLSRLDEKPEVDDDSDKNSSSSYKHSSSSSTGGARIQDIMKSDDDSSSSSSGVTYVGSVNSDKFHYPSCTHAKRIKDSNKVTFSSRDDAISRGYSPCGVCTP